MSELKVEGKLYKIFDTQDISATFKKREFVIETDDKYPQLVKFELTQDNCDKISDFKEGENIVVHFNIRGREWTSPKNEVKYFVSLNAWRLEKEQATAPATETPFPSADAEPPADSFADDLPF